jgi:hypothetical protein
MSEDAHPEACGPEQKAPQAEAGTGRAESMSAQDMHLAVARHIWRLSTDANGAITDLDRAIKALQQAKNSSLAAPAARGTSRSRATNDEMADDDLELPVIVHRFIKPEGR